MGSAFVAPANAQEERLAFLGDLTYDEKIEMLGEFSGEELFGLGTAEYNRAAFEESQKNRCEIEMPAGRGAVTTNTWPGGLVPYAFNGNVNATNQNRAIQAMQALEAAAPLTFVPRTNESAFIIFNDAGGNSSPVGRQSGGQTINIASWSFRFIIAHEIMHSLGFWHEQQRPDRGTYVQINFGNVQSGTGGNFTIPGNSIAEGEYDFESIMHYGQCDFTTCSSCNSSCRTITVLPPFTSQQSVIGQRGQLSAGDIASLNALYGGGNAPLPVMDDFEATTLDQGTWFASNGAGVNTQAINETSGIRSLNIGGQQSVRTLSLSAFEFGDITVAYEWERTGNGNSPENGEDLVVDYLNNQGAWIEIARYLGSGPDMSNFQTDSHALPSDAQHNDLRVRFTALGTSPGNDEYFIDDVLITGTPISPGDFSVITPVDGATQVATSPAFQWEMAPGASSYRLLVDNSMNFSSPNLDFTTAFTNFSNPGFQLSEGQTYFWKVEAINSNGTTASSPTPSMFRTQGGSCKGDCDGNFVVNFNDLVCILFRFGNAGEDEDVDCDGGALPDLEPAIRAIPSMMRLC